MDSFHYQHGELFCETLPVEDIARRYGTPVIVYSAAALRENVKQVREAFSELDPAIRFPVSTLPSPGVLRTLAAEGCGMAAISGGELERAWLSKAPMNEVLFAGVGKSDDDIRAALDGIYSPLFQAGVTVDGRPPYYRGPTGWLVAESLEEIERFAVIAGSLRVNCRIAVRINTALEVPADETVLAADADSKFGVSRSLAVEAFRRFEYRQHVRLAGLASHVGQRSHDVATYTANIRRLLETAEEIRQTGHKIELIDVGGGLPSIGISRSTPPAAAYARAITPMFAPWRDAGTTIAIQPGRPVAASAGLLIVGVRDIKPAEDRRVVICDTGLNPAARPADVDGFRVVWPIATEPGLEPPREGVERLDTTGLDWYDLVGPSGRDNDLIGRSRLIPHVKPGARLAIFGAGADALATVQRGNDHTLPAEVLVEGRTMRPLRPRAGLIEQLAPELGPLEKL
ncbi:MAG: hypothetical protein H6810_00620 [Phycisphaeraceae bacterium]|nr:MAG: hypothetical protein H6810_00620 [Phycisphaeraceae bacterium]